MAARRKILVGVVAAVALVLAAIGAGCGSGSSDSSSSTAPPSEPAGSTAPSAEFTGKVGNNRPGSFGRVASDAERESASKVLEKSLKARAAGDWAAQCATLTAVKKAQMEIYAAPGGGCPSGLKVEGEPFAATKADRVNTMTGPIAVLRVEGKLGFALYHGKKHQDYAMFMKKEGGEWKVGHLATNEVP